MTNESVEATFFPDMAERRTRDIVRDGALARGDVEHLRCRRVEKLRIRIDETTDEPRAGDAIDFRTFARDPARGAAIAKQRLELRVDDCVRHHTLLAPERERSGTWTNASQRAPA